MLKCIENCGLRHLTKRVARAKCQKIFKLTLYIYIFLRNQTKKIYNRAKELYCDSTIFVSWFFVYLPKKKMETRKSPKATDYPRKKKQASERVSQRVMHIIRSKTLGATLDTKSLAKILAESLAETLGENWRDRWREFTPKSLAKSLVESLGSDYMHDSLRDSLRDLFFFMQVSTTSFSWNL